MTKRRKKILTVAAVLGAGGLAALGYTVEAREILSLVLGG